MPHNQTLPTWLALNACDDASATGMADQRTNTPYYGGALNLGDYFDLTDAEAKMLSYTTTGTLYAGRYRRVQVDSAATAAYVKQGTIGYQVSGKQMDLNLVTSYDKGIVGIHPVVFLNAITPGNYGFVQELGIATCLCGATITKAGGGASGDLCNAAATGVVDDPTTQTPIIGTIGIFFDPPGPSRKVRVAMGTGVPVVNQG
jgi:hypothetical protein